MMPSPFKGNPDFARTAGSAGGKKSPTNFRNDPNLASKAGSLSKRKPVQVTCGWCGDTIAKRDLRKHRKLMHPNLYAKLGMD